jgi:hypothetical protein
MASKPDNRVADKERGAINIRRVPRQTRRDFKRWCMDLNVSMEHALVQMIEQVLAGQLKPTIRPDDSPL